MTAMTDPMTATDRVELSRLVWLEVGLVGLVELSGRKGGLPRPLSVVLSLNCRGCSIAQVTVVNVLFIRSSLLPQDDVAIYRQVRSGGTIQYTSERCWMA